MALTGTTDSPGHTANTPTADTGVIVAIRAFIQPRRGWWQFELQTWHYLVSVGSTAVAIAAFVYLITTHGGTR